MKAKFVFMAFLMAIVAMSVISCEEVPENTSAADRVDLYYYGQVYENDTIKAARHFVLDFVTITHDDESHEYIIVKSGAGNYLGISHWEGCEFCKKNIDPDPYLPADYESVFGTPENKSTWSW